MKRKKLIYIVSDIDKSLHFEWVAACLQSQYQLSFILIGRKDTFFEQFLRGSNISVYTIEHNSKKRFFSTWIKVFRILKVEKPDIVHTHLWIANLIGLTASWSLRVKKRIFTRHHGTIHYTEFPSGRKWDKLCNYLATDIIAISKNVEEILTDMDGAKRQKITLIHHGFDFSYFSNVPEHRVKALRDKLNLSAEATPVIGIISRFVAWKGVQYIIPAFRQVLDKFPNAVLILANASGGYESEIRKLLETLPSPSYRTIRFENDLAALYKIFNVMVHVPVDFRSEAFGQTYVEPLIASVPSVFTQSGIAAEFIEHDRNALVVDFQSTEQIEEQILRLLSDPELVERLKVNGRTSVEQFSILTYLRRLNLLYMAS